MLTLHTLSTRNPLSTGYYFNFDCFDMWDGTPLPCGQAEAPFATNWNWTEDVSTVASNGRYSHDGTAMWSACTSDRVIYQALATSWAVQIATCQLPGYTDPGMFTIVGHSLSAILIHRLPGNLIHPSSPKVIHGSSGALSQ